MNEFLPLFNQIYKADKYAINLSTLLLDIAHTWDDLIDKDKPVADEQINRAFLSATVDLTMNPLWDKHLASNLLNVYFRWSDANSIERDCSSTDDDLAKAWMLRAGLYDMFVLIAHKLYGRTWAEQVGPIIRKYYGETLIGFIEEVRNA